MFELINSYPIFELPAIKTFISCNDGADGAFDFVSSERVHTYKHALQVAERCYDYCKIWNKHPRLLSAEDMKTIAVKGPHIAFEFKVNQ